MKKQIVLGVLALLASGLVLGSGVAEAHSRCRDGWGRRPPAWGWNNPHRARFGNGGWRHRGYDGYYRRVANSDSWRNPWRGPRGGYGPGYGGGDWHPGRW